MLFRSPVGPDPAEGGVATGPSSSATACPCWDETHLVTALPAIHFYRDADGMISVNRFDHDNAQQIQALLTIAPGGGGSCELASFGTSGRIEALAAAEGLTETQCAACEALLVGLAIRAGMVSDPSVETSVE